MELKPRFKAELVKQVRKNMLKKDNWLRVRTKKTDQKCENCRRMHADIPGDIALIAVDGQLNKHVCAECADLYIGLGAEDIEAEIKNRAEKKKELISRIREFGTYSERGMYTRKLDDLELDELETIHKNHAAIRAEKDRIAAIVISAEDAKMEPYLEIDYGIIQDTEYLKCVEQIEPYFKEDYGDLFDCGQGYYQDTENQIIKIGRKFYSVTITAEIGSSKQDRGDRLYWVEGIEKVEWEEIPKPLPKEYDDYSYSFTFNPDQKSRFDSLLKEVGFEPITVDKIDK